MALKGRISAGSLGLRTAVHNLSCSSFLRNGVTYSVPLYSYGRSALSCHVNVCTWSRASVAAYSNGKHTEPGSDTDCSCHVRHSIARSIHSLSILARSLLPLLPRAICPPPPGAKAVRAPQQRMPSRQQRRSSAPLLISTSQSVL